MIELETLRKALNPAQLLFADLYISDYANVQNGTVLVSDLYCEAFPDCKSTKSQRTNAWRLLRSVGPTSEYIEAVLATSGKNTTKGQIADLDELKEYMTKNMRGINELFEDILCSRMYPVESKDGVIYTSGLFVDDLDEIPQHLVKYITGAKLISGHGWLVKTNSSQADKDRNKCAEMLTKMQGGFIDKVEMSGPGGGAIQVTLSGDVKLDIRKILDDI